MMTHQAPERLSAPRVIQPGPAWRPSAGGLIYPTGHRIIEPIEWGSGEVDVNLTNDDAGKLIFWDARAAAAAPYHDGSERVFCLPPTPEVGMVFWIQVVLTYVAYIRFTALNHSLTSYTVAWPYWVNTDETPEDVGDYPNTRAHTLSHCFNWREGRWERERITLYGISGASEVISLVVIGYTGEKSSYPIGYIDEDDDGLFNAHPGDHEPLVYGDFYNWKLLRMSRVTPGSPALNLWWTSIEGPYGS